MAGTDWLTAPLRDALDLPETLSRLTDSLDGMSRRMDDQRDETVRSTAETERLRKTAAGLSEDIEGLRVDLGGLRESLRRIEDQIPNL